MPQTIKLQENGKLDNLLKVLKHFLTNRKQRVVSKLVSAIYFSPNDSPSKTMKDVFYFT